MAQIPPIDDAYINEIIKSNGPYNPALLKTQGLKMRELIKLLRDRMEQGDTGVVHTTGDESISGTKTFTLIKAEGLSVNNLANPSLSTIISPITGVQTKLLNITEGAFGVQLSSSVLSASRSQLLPDKDGVIALTSDLSAFATLSEVNTELALKIDNTARGVPGGVSTLDGGGKILTSQLPDSISGALTYQGTWNATTNTPVLVDPPASSTKGHYYVTNAAGTQFGITFAVGDWIVSNGTAWEKVDNTDAVATVFGRLGNILANEGDYSSYYPLLTGSYADPSWITSIPYSKITGAPVLTGYVDLTTNQTIDGTKTFLEELFVNGVKVGKGSGTQNAASTAIGASSLQANTTGRDNVGVGYVALLVNTTGSRNIALGGFSLTHNTTGNNNTGIGYQALVANITGSNNIAIGDNSLYANTSGNNNIAIGSLSLLANTGNSNIAHGVQALSANTTGNGNTAIGLSALQTNTTGNNNTALGNANVSVGNLENATVIGAGAVVNESNKVQLGNASVTKLAVSTTTFTGLNGSNKTFVLPAIGGILAISVNGQTPDVNGNINIPSGGTSLTLDQVLTAGNTSTLGMNVGNVTTTGAINVGTNINFGTGTISPGVASALYRSDLGLVISTKAGTGTDFSLVAPDGGIILNVGTGTKNVNFTNSLSVGGLSINSLTVNTASTGTRLLSKGPNLSTRGKFTLSVANGANGAGSDILNVLELNSVGDATFSGNVTAPKATVSGAPVNPTDVVRLMDVPILSSGTYTPTFTASTNVAAIVTGYTSHYIRTGNQVTVTGRFGLSVTTALIGTIFYCTLPIPSNLNGGDDLTGLFTAQSYGTSLPATGGTIVEESTLESAKFYFIPSEAVAPGYDITFSFMYTVK
ncbi:beta strand repeat-containing protein [Pedobacter nyackensis]|uniref:Uncharacterized protein n=1 Tax=Pedobacter nyackensis TaxID=475255 RepID=A0A1W2A1L6_9SPHI|nr:hypothetical protein [Pedobacter nyackensis]SMC54321.1 hypothetical protein SAMN04488101_101235 [Pedobacter nyackensis]